MARRGRKLGIWLAVVLAVVIGLLVGVDRAGAWAAERTIADQSAAQMRQLGVASAEPEVTVGGFPFLTQVARGQYEEITIVLRDVEKGGVRLPELDVRATDVKAELGTLLSGSGQVTADRIAGTATVGYDSVQALVEVAAGRLGAQNAIAISPGLTVSAEDGKLRLRVPVTVAGQSFTAAGTGTVRIDGGKIQLAVTDIRAEGVTLPPQGQRVLTGYLQRLAAEVSVPPLPFQLKIDSVQARPEGLVISASAQGVPLVG